MIAYILLSVTISTTAQSLHQQPVRDDQDAIHLQTHSFVPQLFNPNPQLFQKQNNTDSLPYFVGKNGFDHEECGSQSVPCMFPDVNSLL